MIADYPQILMHEICNIDGWNAPAVYIGHVYAINLIGFGQWTHISWFSNGCIIESWNHIFIQIWFAWKINMRGVCLNNIVLRRNFGNLFGKIQCDCMKSMRNYKCQSTTDIEFHFLNENNAPHPFYDPTRLYWFNGKFSKKHKPITLVFIYNNGTFERNYEMRIVIGSWMTCCHNFIQKYFAFCSFIQSAKCILHCILSLNILFTVNNANNKHEPLSQMQIDKRA